MRVLLLLACSAISGCAESNDSLVLKVGGGNYEVPRSHVSSRADKPHQFARVSARGRNFDLIYDSRTIGRHDAFGWPIIFSLNEAREPSLYRLQQADIRIVCRRAVNPLGGCGFKVAHRGVEWSVLFPEGELRRVPAIRERALAALSGYWA